MDGAGFLPSTAHLKLVFRMFIQIMYINVCLGCEKDQAGQITKRQIGGL